VDEAKLRQLSLLDDRPVRPLAREVEEKAFELLVQLLIAVSKSLGKGSGDEQDHK
jgi:hypothetical protein